MVFLLSWVCADMSWNKGAPEASWNRDESFPLKHIHESLGQPILVTCPQASQMLTINVKKS